MSRHEFPSKSATSEQLPFLRLSLCGGPITSEGFVESSLLFLNRLGNGPGSCFVGLRCFGKTSYSCDFPCVCMPLPSFSFQLHTCSSHYSHFTFMFFPCHAPFICTHFLSFCHFASNGIHVLSFSFRLSAFSFWFAFMSFHVFPCPFCSYGYGFRAWQGDRVQQVRIAKLSLRFSLRLSLNNLSTI